MAKYFMGFTSGNAFTGTRSLGGSFTMPSADTTVTATWASDPGMSFSGHSGAGTLGIVQTGQTTSNGWSLEWIDGNFNRVTTNPLTSQALTEVDVRKWLCEWDQANLSWYPSAIHGTNSVDNSNAVYGDSTDGTSYVKYVDPQGDVYRRIPLMYTKRGIVPSGKTDTGKWYMLFSFSPLSVSQNGFYYNGPCFNCDWVSGKSPNPYFYFGQYQASWDGEGLPRAQSVPNQTPLVNISFIDAMGYSRVKTNTDGTASHMLSIQEYWEVASRIALCKRTFNIFNTSDRNYSTKGRTNYFGCNDLAPGVTSTGANGVCYAEWRSGYQNNSSCAPCIKAWANNPCVGTSAADSTGDNPTAANGWLVLTNSVVPGNTDNTGLIGALASGGTHNELDSLWLCQSTAVNSSSMIPDITYRSGVIANAICAQDFTPLTRFGSFSSFVSYNPTDVGANQGFRLSKTIVS